MRTTTTAHTRTARLTVLTILLTMLALLAAAPAHAAEPLGLDELVHPTAPPVPPVPPIPPVPTLPEGVPTEVPEPPGPGVPPGGLVPPTETPEPPEPTVTIDAHGVCDPHAGIDYAIAVQNPPDGAIAYKAQWRVPDGQVQTVDGQSGVIPTGEGHFEIRGVLHYQGPGFYPTEFTDVTVDCDDDYPGGDRPIIVRPNFTG